MKNNFLIYINNCREICELQDITKQLFNTLEINFQNSNYIFRCVIYCISNLLTTNEKVEIFY